MTGLSDGAVSRLRSVATWPEFESPRYVAVEEIGRGGMGTVYRATDDLLARDVAVKIPNGFGTAAVAARLQTEAAALARLEHPGIVPIHDAGRLADGRLFYVMKLVRGKTLEAHLADRPGLSDRLGIFERICEPVAFAHALGFVHRDLKPENVMLGAFGEVLVMDWGAALLTDAGENPDPGPPALSRERQTEDGTAIGTRGFMAPEQMTARGPDRCAGGCLRSRRRAVSDADRRPACGDRAYRRSRISTRPACRAPRDLHPGDVASARRSVSGRPEPRG